MKKPLTPPPLRAIFEKSDQLRNVWIHTISPPVAALLREMNEKYYHWDEFRHFKLPDKIPESLNHEKLWGLAKLTRRGTEKLLRVTDILFNYNLTNPMLKTLHNLDMNLGGIIKKEIVSEQEKTKYLVNSLMEEAIASSQLEGAATSRIAAKEMLRTERKPKNESEKMILNNYRTIQKVVSMKGEKMTLEKLLEIHKTITEGTLKDANHEGKFRDSDQIQVTDQETGEAFYSPPDHNSVPKLVEELLRFANEKNEEDFTHPIVIGIILHFLVGYIHPFFDGNGRTARAMYYWYLVSQGYWLIEYMPISRQIKKAPAKYARAYLYTETDENDLTYFLKFNLEALDQSRKDLEKYVQRKIKEKEEMFHYLKVPGINSRQQSILKDFADNPTKIATMYEIKNMYSVTYQTARTDLYGLEKMGFLSRKKGDRKKYLFMRTEDFQKKINEYLKEKKTS